MAMCPGIQILFSNAIIAKANEIEANEIEAQNVGHDYKEKPLKVQADFVDTSLSFSSLQMES